MRLPVSNKSEFVISTWGFYQDTILFIKMVGCVVVGSGKVRADMVYLCRSRGNVAGTSSITPQHIYPEASWKPYTMGVRGTSVQSS